MHLPPHVSRAGAFARVRPPAGARGSALPILLMLLPLLSPWGGTSAFAAPPAITNLGPLPGGNFSGASAITPDGVSVSGNSTGPSVPHAARWTSGVVQDLGILPGGNYSAASALSGDGSVVVGISAQLSGANRAFRWTSASGMQSIGVLGTGTASAANAVSADGSVVAGFSDTAGSSAGRAFRWTAGTGMQSLGNVDSNAFGMSADGTAIVGIASTVPAGCAFRWTSGTGIQSLGVLPGDVTSVAYGISRDGLAVTGSSGDATGRTRAMVWTSAGGMQEVGLLPGDDAAQGFAVSGDHSTVLGDSFSGTTNVQRSFIWTASSGIVNLRSYVASLGGDVTGWQLQSARGISADGTSIVGSGTFNGASRAFLINNVPEPGAALTLLVACAAAGLHRRYRKGV